MVSWVGRVNMHHRIKLHPNHANDFGDIAFNGFQNGGHLGFLKI